ncbi:MAG: EamA family transporter [Clostridiaceae bacterium]|nr:EamA family transporter [Clostridiaceae bacterium]
MYLLCTAVLWSFSGVLSKYIPWGALPIACFRGIIGGITQVLLTRTWRIRLSKPIILTAICYLGESLLIIFANKYTTAGSAIVLQNTSPLYIMAMAWLLFRQKPTKLDFFAGAAIFSGIVLSLADSFGSSGLTGNVMALASGVFYAGIFFTGRLPGADPLQSTILSNAFYLLLLPLALQDPVLRNPSLAAVSSAKAWAAMLFMGVFQMGLSWLLFSKGIRTTPALRANFLTMIEPVLNPVWALLILGERMGFLSVIGSVIVLASVCVYNVLSLKKQQAPDTTPGT